MNSNKVLLTFLVLILVVSCRKDEEQILTLESKLDSIEGIIYRKIETQPGFDRVFEIKVKQPVDHNNPGGPEFDQLVYLKHKDESLPVILNTRGYGIADKSGSSLNSIFEANYLGVEHRYFNNSIPTNVEWNYLNIEQSAADHHRIVELFYDIYRGKWVNTGVSKGGMSALFHRFFYPDDVDATVAFVAPIMTGLPDSRFKDYFEQAGDEQCRQKIKNFQQLMLGKKSEMIAYIASYESNKNYTFSMAYDRVLEYSVLEYPFYFWQYGDGDCDLIPDENVDNESLFNYLLEVSPMSYYRDLAVKHFAPFYYQAFTELGYYFFDVEHLSDLVTLPDPSHRLLGPANVTMTYNPQPMIEVQSWLQNSGSNIMYVYGGNDPYTATGVELSGSTNAVKFVQPGANHNVKILDLDKKEQAYSTLENWLSISISR